jgi:hypothetical protein
MRDGGRGAAPWVDGYAVIPFVLSPYISPARGARTPGLAFSALARAEDLFCKNAVAEGQ